MLNACKIWILLSLATMMLFAGCSDDVLREDLPEEEKPAGNVYIRLQMNLNSDGPAGSRAASRAGEDSTDPETPGKGNENAVNTIDILVFDATTDELTDIVFLDETQIGQITSDDGIVVPIFAKQGQKVKIYAAVNMTVAMRQFFTLGSTGTDFSLSSTGNSYWDVINEFVPGSNGKQTTLEDNPNGCIPMTGQFNVESVSDGDTDNTTGSGEITIKGHTTKDNPLSVKADVSRIVAKVHVLAKADTDGYAIATDSKQNNARIGWIKLADVRYIPNGTNKSSYIFPQEKNNTLKDKNMDLEHYLVGGKINAQLWGPDYVFLDGKTVHKANIDSYMEVAEQYDSGKLENTSKTEDPNEPNRYYKGMYCLENYFDIPSNRTLFDEYEDVIPMITHVSIAAKMTPCEILVESDFEKKMKAFVTSYKENKDDFRQTYGLNELDENDINALAETFTLWDSQIRSIVTNSKIEHGFKKISFDETIEEEKKISYIRHILNWSLMINNVWSNEPSKFDDGRYSDGTFYVYDQKFDDDTYTGSRYLYLTVGAVSSASDENIHIKARSVPHIGGWGYYYTYIDNDGSTQNGKTPYTASQVTRNTYYIITVENFGYPGGSITNSEYIKVNTRPVGWDYVGKGNINLH